MQQRRLGPFYLLVIFTAFLLLPTAYAEDTESEDSVSSEAVSTTVQAEIGEESEETTTEEVLKSEPVTVNGESQKIETTTYRVQEGNEETLGTSAPVIGQYSVPYEDGDPCVQLEVDCTITFNYKTKSGERDDNEYLPTTIKAEGDCTDEDASTMILKWNGNTMTWYFSKTLGRERWYVRKIELLVDTTTSKFQNIINPGLRKLTTKEHAMFFPTPVGKSYSCQDETSVELQGKDIDATVFLRGFKLQPFMYKKDFGPVYECSPGGARAFRDETAPIAVGSTLAIVVLLTVTGYGVYRYFKIKKVQYDTME